MTGNQKTTIAEPWNRHIRTLALILAVVSSGVRLWLVIRSGNNSAGELSLGSDAPAYILLGHNILQGRGMTYAGQPTALRAPLYPMFLALVEFFFRGHYLLAVRILQLAIGILTALVCSRAAERLWGKKVKELAFALPLSLPTLIFFAPQILTETVAAFFVACFLYFLIQECTEESVKAPWGLGLTTGVLLLLRFNTVFLPVVAGVASASPREGRSSWQWKRAALPIALSALIVSPWLIRNWNVFHGQILYSSQTGTTAVQGALTPQGRTQGNDGHVLLTVQGWRLRYIETNDPSRNAFPSEAELERKTRKAAVNAWLGLGWRVPVLLVEKLTFFWLSSDQILDTTDFSLAQRVLRGSGVIYYWIILAAAGFGWYLLRAGQRRIAQLFFLYAVLGTVMHLPFTMNTRLRSPLMDPLICMLAPGGIVSLLRTSNRTDPEDSADART